MSNPDWLRYCKRVVRAGLGTDHLLRPEIRIPSKHVGSRYGGWTIATAPLRERTRPVVLSFGLGDDISFDEAMVEAYGARVYGFDPTPMSLGWIARRGVPPGMQVEPIGIAAFDGEQVLSTPESDKRGNFSATQRFGVIITCPMKRYSTILAMLDLQEVDVLKLDIEGSEYDVVDDVLSSPILPTQLLIEFHHRVRRSIDVSDTLRTVRTIRQAGFALFSVSPSGHEMSFIQRRSLNGQDRTGKHWESERVVLMPG